MKDNQTIVNEHALATAMTLLMNVRAPSMDQIRSAVQNAALVVPKPPGEAVEPDAEWILHRVQAACNVTVGIESVLIDPTLHTPWLHGTRRSDISWRFWDRYATWLRSRKQWPEPILSKLDGLTERILSFLQDPMRPGAWSTKGMVVGSVQSGKTANYSGLVCKAADAGYKLIVILGGMQNSLRSQTQLRLDEGFFGFNTARATRYGSGTNRIGVGMIKTPDELRCHALTGSAEQGDFKAESANTVNVIPGGTEPVYLVIKKHKSIIQNLINWLSILAEDDGNNGPKLVRNLPFLVIDDEADNGSINTRGIPKDEDGNPLPDYDVTAINGKIRELLKLFEKSAYVGYTATPFANIFIDPIESSEKYGEDLFPRNFIVSLPPPSNYIGPAKVFGFDGSSEAGIAPEPGLGIVVEVEDSSTWLPIPHKNHTHPAGPLPKSLKTAVLDFILACAGRRARGEKAVHNSMLVHVTRFKVTQQAVSDQIEEFLATIKNRIRYGDGDRKPSILDDLRSRWKSEFEKRYSSIESAIDDPLLTPLAWNQVKSELKEAVASIEVRTINGTAGDILDYHQRPDGISVIAVGGDKLSRGLTLEGLSVSYFLRTSKMYDTLMQMGRWFGYRPGYVDLCRLHLGKDLLSWYRHIALASEELRTELEHMADIRSTPMEYGLRVRMHPSGMLITGLNKMRNGTPMRVSFNGTLNETILFDLEPNRLAENLKAATRLLEFVATKSKPTKSHRGSAHIWKSIEADAVIDFLEQYKTHPEAKRVDSKMLARFIRRRLAQGELGSWTVGIVSSDAKIAKRIILPGLPEEIGLYQRDSIDGKIESPEAPMWKYAIKRLVSPNNEAADLSPNQYDSALAMTKEAARKNDKKEPSYALGPYLRMQRSRHNGLLLLYPLDPKFPNEEREKPVIANVSQDVIMGFALSFPKETQHINDGLDYMVNFVYASNQDFELE